MQYSPERRERAILEAERSFNAGTISVTLVDIMKNDPTFSFADAEMILRNYNTNTYLVAVPTIHVPPGLRVLGLDHDPRDFFLWVCLHGYQEAVEKLCSVGVRSFDDNLQNLRSTGLLTQV